jgi:hypothetical protein
MMTKPKTPERDALREAKDVSVEASVSPDFRVSTPDGGPWEGRYFVWDCRTRSMTKELSAADLNLMLTRRPPQRAGGQE